MSCLGLCDLDAFVSHCIELNGALAEHWEVASASAGELSMTQQLRNEQDLAYQRSLEADSRKEMERAALERVRLDQEAQERARTVELERRKEERKNHINELLNRLAVNGTDAKDLKISIQLLDGRRVIRSFSQRDSMGVLYDFVFTEVGHDIGISYEDITLRTILPPQYFQCNPNQTISEAGIGNKMKLIVELKENN